MSGNTFYKTLVSHILDHVIVVIFMLRNEPIHPFELEMHIEDMHTLT